MSTSDGSDEPGSMEEQIKSLQQGKNESDLKLKAMEDNISKILALMQSQSSSQASPSVSVAETPVSQQCPTQLVQPATSTVSSRTSSTATSQSSTATPTSQPQPTSVLPSHPGTWSSTRTTIPIPTMSEGMTFREYKNKVKLWSRNTDIPANRRAALLLMQLPTKDKHGGLYHIIYDRVNLDHLEQEDGVNTLMDKLAEILDDPDFVRLANWWEKFSTFKQKPGMSTEKFFTEFHLLKNEAKNEFNFELPAQLLTATLMKACTDIPPDQIGIITANIDLRHSDVDKSVENAIRQYMQSRQAYGSGKGSTKVFHCATNDRDVLGNVIGEDSDDDNDDNSVLLNSKKRSREEHVKAKEIARKKGLCTICFKKHAYKDCPQKEETESRVKKYKLSKGIPWKNDDGSWTLPDGKIVQELPKESSSHPVKLATGRCNDGATANTVTIDEDCLFGTEAFQGIRESNCMLIEKEDDDDVPTDPSITKAEPHADQDHDEIHSVNISSGVLLAIDNNLRAIMDTGCSRALAGSNWIKTFYSQMSQDDQKQVQKLPSKATFKFGDGHVHKSSTIWILPVYFGSLRKRIALDEVDAAI